MSLHPLYIVLLVGDVIPLSVETIRIVNVFSRPFEYLRPSALYALLHHPAYRERFAANLKRELPRIPFAPDFRAFSEAGRALARLHVDYESLPAWPLQAIENDSLRYSESVTKMKLSETKDSIRINESLTLTGIPPEAFEYKLGSRSALEWVIDQYQIKGDSDPNREDDPLYILRLVGQVVRVSIETVRIVSTLPQPF